MGLCFGCVFSWWFGFCGHGNVGSTLCVCVRVWTLLVCIAGVSVGVDPKYLLYLVPLYFVPSFEMI